MSKQLPILAIALTLLAGCGGTSQVEQTNLGSSNSARQEISAIALASPGSSQAALFSKLNHEELGLQFENFLKRENHREYLLNGGGVTSGDFDNDGMVDLYLVSQDGPNKLFRQTDVWQFEDVTSSAGVAGPDLWDSGATFADVNGDGYLDIYLCVTNGKNLLYVNQKDGSFDECGAEFGIDHPGASTMAAFADVDNDGDLDFYLLNNRVFTSPEEAPNPKIIETRNGEKKFHPDFQEHYFFIGDRINRAGQQDVLFRNDGGKFVDVSQESGIAGFDMGLSATWWDYDQDGWIDLYVANDMKTPDHLYRNLGNGRFKDVIADVTGHTPWFAMGADFGDINNDGELDFLAADMSSTTHYKQKTTMGEMGNSAWFLTYGKPRQFMRNTLLLNSGTQRFWEAANLTGLDSTDWTWSVRLFDADCDGRLDAFFTNGYGKNINDSDHQKKVKALQEAGKMEEAIALANSIGPLKESNLMFRNGGELSFENVSEQWGVNHEGVSNACTTVDIDRDGDLDLLVSNLNEPLSVYRNDCGSANRIVFKLNGTVSNATGLGATIRLTTQSGQQVRQMASARGYMSSDEALIHFGLGDNEKADKVVVLWPSGIKQSFTDLAAGNLYTINEQGEPKQRGSTKQLPDPVFDVANESLRLQHTHLELDFDDYSMQPLLPNKLSQLGPGVAWADVNGDGFSDCYVAGAAGQIGALYLGGKENFARQPGPWTKKLTTEEMGCLFVDIDSDSDQDLYIVSGGYAKEMGHESYRDQIYLNDGKGNFSEAVDVLPDLRDSGSCVCAADVDKDGDLDLFVGTRCLPHRWPLAADSRLLINENGRFKEAETENASVLKSLGLVTSAVWSDADGDGWLDLLVALEWGPVRIFKNQNGKLVDHTDVAGLSEALGWWNSISPGDIDHDGDMDFVAMNTGLNTKYHADEKHPVTLFAKDFDGNGRIDLVESEWEDDKCFPIRGKSCSTHAMPMISEKFPTYHEFALAELSDIYGDDLDAAKQFTANYLQSVVLVNDGNGKFEIKPLPRLAQISPGFGTAIADFDADGFNDVVIAQNFMHPQPETGQMDGGQGLLLKGDGTGNFLAVGPAESGISIPGQAMAVALTDVNADGRPDALVSVNDDSVVLLRNHSNTAMKPVRIRLVGAKENYSAVGARVFVQQTLESTRRTVFDVNAGHGYLTQSDGSIFVATAFDKLLVEVVWPDGTSQSEVVDTKTSSIVIEKSAQTEP